MDKRDVHPNLDARTRLLLAGRRRGGRPVAGAGDALVLVDPTTGQVAVVGVLFKRPGTDESFIVHEVEDGGDEARVRLQTAHTHRFGQWLTLPIQVRQGRRAVVLPA